jgi:hypothetical protein
MAYVSAVIVNGDDDDDGVTEHWVATHVVDHVYDHDADSFDVDVLAPGYPPPPPAPRPRDTNHYAAGTAAVTVVKRPIGVDSRARTSLYPARVFINSPPLDPPSKAAQCSHAPPFVVPTHSATPSAHDGLNSSAAAPVQHTCVVDAVPIERRPDPVPHGYGGSTSPPRPPNYGAQFLYRDDLYYATRAAVGGGYIVRHAAPVVPEVPVVVDEGATSQRSSPRRSPARSRVAFNYVSDADRGIALKVVRCCIFSDHLASTDFPRRIRMARTEARHIYESMTASDAWCHGSPAGTTATQVLVHNCFGEILRAGGSAPVDWARWFNGVSRRRVEEAFKRITTQVDAMGLVLDRNSRGFLVYLRPPHVKAIAN